MKNELYHYGTKGHSGRYPPGSGKNPKTGPRARRNRVKRTKKQGHALSDVKKDIKKGENILNQNKKLLKTKAILITSNKGEKNRYMMNNDYEIPKGSILHRVGKHKEGLTYCTLLRGDFKNYDNDHFWEIGESTSLLRYKTKETLNVASGNSTLKFVLKKMGHNDVYKEYEKLSKKNKSPWLSEYDLYDAVDTVFKNKTKDERSKISNDILDGADVYKSPYKDEIISHFQKKGYNAMVDPVDTLYSYSESPTIVFDANKSMKRTKTIDMWSPEYDKYETKYGKR